MTRYFNWTNEINNEELSICANILKEEGIVVFPTETVYGIGANALSEYAVNKIFGAKGRANDNPLIVHISNIDMIYDLAKEINETEQKLIDAFFPGPFTLILKKKNIIPNNVTAGLDTVGIRMPSGKIANELISACNLPLAAPSANISGKPSGTKMEDIKEELDGKVDVMVDGGTCDIGIESTVVKVIDEIPVILRPGKITPEDIEKVIGKVKINDKIFSKANEGEKVESPGMKYRHYAPNAKCLLVCGDKKEEIINKNITENTIVIGCENLKEKINTNKFISYGNSLEEISKNIFTILRKVDLEKPDLIIIEGVEKKGLGIAIMNRLIRACEYNIIE